VFPKPHLTWKEPEGFRKAHAELKRSLRKWWHQPLHAGVVAAVFMLAWGMSLITSDAPLPFLWVLPLSLGGAVLVVYGAPFLHAASASEVSLWTKRLQVTRGDGFSVGWDRFAAFEWRENGEFASLVLHRAEGRDPVIVGVPLDVSRDTVSEFLGGHGIPNLATGEPPRVVKSTIPSLRAEVGVCIMIAGFFSAIIVWFALKMQTVVERAGVNIADLPLPARLMTSAHIVGPAILLSTVLIGVWMKRRNPKTVWPRIITFLVGFILLLFLCAGGKGLVHAVNAKTEPKRKIAPNVELESPQTR
jgi:hypothetical protein